MSSFLSEYRSSLMGVSILFIILFHSFVGWEWTPVTRMFVRGDIGVEFFLILSALGMYHSLTKDDSIKRFYKKRVLRIFPTYWLVGIPVFLFFGMYDSEGYRNIIWDLTTISCFWGRIRYWFIHLILICYLISPLCKKYVDSRYATVFLPVTLVFAGVFLAAQFPKYEIIIGRISIFLLGFHLARYLDKVGGGKFYIHPYISILTFVVALSILYSLSFVSLTHRWLRLVYFFISIPLIMSLANMIPLLGKTVRKGLDFLGAHTLELYLVHESICTTIVWKYYHENVYIYAMLCFAMAIPLAVAVKKVSNKVSSWLFVRK